MLPSPIKVRIRNEDGHYLVRGAASLGFSPDSSKALVLDYVGHSVAEQLDILRKTQGIRLEIEEVDPREVLERCDGCAKLFSPFSVVLREGKFLCPQCLVKNG